MELNAYYEKPSIEQKYKAIPFKDSKYLLTNDFMGVEIELEGIGEVEGDFPSAYWTTHNDGSLRNNGREFVFRMPLRGSQIEEALVSLQKYLKQHCKPHISPRTSTHIHVNVDNMTEDQLIKFNVIYLLYEKLFFQTFSPERIDNHFCVPMAQCDSILESIRNFNQTKDWKVFLKEMREDVGRYGAFNMMAIPKFSSVEFRHFLASWDAEEILEWCNTILHLKRFAQVNSSNLVELVYEISRTGYVNFTYQVFDKKIADKFIKAKGFETSIIEGIRLVQSLIHPTEFKLPEKIHAAVKKRQREMAAKKNEVKKKIYADIEDARRGLQEGGGEGQGPPEPKPAPAPRFPGEPGQVVGVRNPVRLDPPPIAGRNIFRELDAAVNRLAQQEVNIRQNQRMQNWQWEINPPIDQQGMIIPAIPQQQVRFVPRQIPDGQGGMMVVIDEVIDNPPQQGEPL